MSRLKTNEKQILEKLFQMGSGYVLNFSDRTMGEFFEDNLGIDIYADIYRYASGSKANCVRGFWREADNNLIGRSVLELVDYIENRVLLGKLDEKDFPEKLLRKGVEIANDLSSEPKEKQPAISTEEEFVKKDFHISLDALGFDAAMTRTLKQRFEEIEKCMRASAPLAVVFLCGSTLEGVMLGIAVKHPKLFNQSPCAPKRNGKVLPFQDWTLSRIIDVGGDVGFLGQDVKKYSHSLRDFRNYIHPYEQTSSGFNPHKHTAKISWQVLQAAIYEITSAEKALSSK